MVFDLHNDYLTAAGFVPPYSPSIVYAIWTTRLPNPLAFLRLAAAEKIRNIAIEDLGFLYESLGFDSFGLFDSSDLSDINPPELTDLFGFSPRYASLTWNGENALAGGAHTDIGLKQFGKQVIRLLGKNGIALDTAHLSRPAFFDAIEAAEQSNTRVICSHTCFDTVFPHPRNLTDTQIKLILECGGLIGLCLVPEFMGKTSENVNITGVKAGINAEIMAEKKAGNKAGIKDVADQIDYFAQKIGSKGLKSLAIGSDFFGTDFPALKNYYAFGQLRQSLSKMGYTQTEIDQIFFLNAKTYFTHSPKE